MTSEPNFQGKIGKTYKESIPDWKEPPSTHDGNSPNVLIILLDDTGFANFGCFGSTIETPILTHLPQMGSDIQIFTLLHYARQQGLHY